MTTEEMLAEILARVKAIEEVRLHAIEAELAILTKAPATPCDVIILEKLQDGRKSLSVRDAMHYAQRTRQTVLDSMRNIADKFPDKFLFRVGDRERNQASRIIVRAVQAKLIDFASICDGKTKFSLRELAKTYGREPEEVKELATAWIQTSGTYRFFIDQYGYEHLVPKA
jgi:hypothetical protein